MLSNSTHINYTKAYRKLHENPDVFAGRSIVPHVGAITELVSKTKSTTLLDYGCGKGQQYFHDNVHMAWGGIMPTLYDPGVVEYSQRPIQQFDGVICTDVMEHVAQIHVSRTLSHIFDYSKKFVFLSICCRPAKKVFADGTNLHLTVKPPKWWDFKLRKISRGRLFVVHYTG